jgi:hypothetical protein
MIFEYFFMSIWFFLLFGKVLVESDSIRGAIVNSRDKLIEVRWTAKSFTAENILQYRRIMLLRHNW